METAHFLLNLKWNVKQLPSPHWTWVTSELAENKKAGMTAMSCSQNALKCEQSQLLHYMSQLHLSLQTLNKKIPLKHTVKITIHRNSSAPAQKIRIYPEHKRDPLNVWLLNEGEKKMNEWMNCSKTESEFAQDIDCSFDDLLLWGTGLFKECLYFLLFISF